MNLKYGLLLSIFVFLGCGTVQESSRLEETETLLNDKNAPLITLNGSSSVTLLKNTEYKEEGAVALDEEDGLLEVDISGVVDTSKIGSCQVHYKAEDRAKNITSKTRNVTIVTKSNLAEDGKAVVPISIGMNASDELLESANHLALKLNQIIGADENSADKFVVERSSDEKGIVLATVDERADLDDGFTPEQPESQEDYYLKTYKEGLYIVGATDKAVESAVADFLHTIGYRHYFPGSEWEVVPYKPNLSVALYKRESPAFYAKNIWYNTGTWRTRDHDTMDSESVQVSNAEMFERWKRHNRVDSKNKMSYGHTYQSIYRQYKERFFNADGSEKEHLLANPNDNRENVKFCVKDSELQSIVIDYAKAYFERYPERDSISLEPSDNGGWYDFNEQDEKGNRLVDNCNDYADGELKSVSDRVIFLANRVAEVLEQDEKTKGKQVTLYAYFKHIAPPNIAVHPNIHVKLQQGFNFSNLTLDELLVEWNKKTATEVAIGDYLSVKHWNYDLPGRAKASKTSSLGKALYAFYKQGIRMYGAESGETWGHTGLGYYIASKVLWEADRISDIDAYIENIKEDFYTHAFENVYVPMKAFYELIDGDNNPRVSKELIGKMYRLLDEARKNAQSANVKLRIESLIYYTRFIELYYLLEHSSEANLYTWKPTLTIQRIASGEGMSSFRLVKLKESCVDTKKEASLLNIDECTTEHNFNFTHQLSSDYEENLEYLGELDKNALEKIKSFITFAYRTKKSMMFHSYAWYDQLIKSPAYYFISKDIKLSASEEEDPWKDSTPLTQEEIDTLLEQGMQTNQSVDFEKKTFSEDLLPATPLHLKSTLPLSEQSIIAQSQMNSSALLSHSIRDRGDVTAYLYLDDGESTFDLNLKNYQRHDIKVTLLRDGNRETFTKDIGINRVRKTITMDNLENGLCKLEFIGNDTIRLYSAFGLTYKTEINDFRTHWFGTLPSFYFYVPKGTTYVRLYTHATSDYPLQIFDANMEKIEEINKSQYVHIKVPNNHDGKLWKYKGGALGVELLTVPPYISYSDEILLPKEVIEADRL